MIVPLVKYICSTANMILLQTLSFKQRDVLTGLFMTVTILSSLDILQTQAKL